MFVRWWVWALLILGFFLGNFTLNRIDERLLEIERRFATEGWNAEGFESASITSGTIVKRDGGGD